ncbi:TonB-dependent receptor [Massilia pseudoviolaceinigra]|uniref:TonB-dependent receptor n=1 Tax=Massilia pseudoviolaceinigra TaxID=3057165 RepID=UPI00279655A5|nr:TonB-dependent receptor [Massilia sp. CCM 9206]MDQ1923636.1 TonB-dependent receptor [Massilia sp. CCM 9206]
MKLLNVKKNKMAVAVAAALWLMAPGVANAADAAPTVETVIVKGQKIDRPLDDTLASVAVVTARDIADHADASLTDIMARLPGVNTQSGNETWGIRGVPVAGFDDQGPATSNGAVSVYVDDALQPHRMLTLSPLPLWDVEQIEVYRGSQSTMQGRNALAGAVVFQTRNPGYTPSLSARINGGNHGQRGAAVAGGGAIVDGKVAARFAADVQSGDGYIRNDTLGKDANPQRNVNLRAKLLLEPVDGLDLLLTLSHARNRRGIQAVNQGPQYYTVSYNTGEFDQLDQDSATLRADYVVNPALTLTSITSSSRGTYDSLLDFDQRADRTQEVLRVHKNKLFNQEVRLAYKVPGLQAQAGVYYGTVGNDMNDRLDFSGETVGSVTGTTRIASRSVFGEVNWDLVPNWQLVGGLRYERERNKTALEDGLASVSSVNQVKTLSALLPKLGLNYRLGPDQLFGAFVQRGYRSGGVNVRVGTAHRAYDPEYTNTVELSHRAAWLDKKLRTTANVYFTDWKDQQVALLDADEELQVANAGHSRMKGVELGAEYRLSPALQLLAGASYSHTRYVDFVAYGDTLSGQSFIGAPRRKVNLGMVYRLNGALTASADAIYQDGSASAYLTDASGKVSNVRRSDDAALVNANLAYRFGKATVSAYVKNVFDRQYIANNQSGRVVDVAAPRTVGVALRYDL